MPKSLYELMKVIEASKEYFKIAKVSKNIETKSYYLELQKTCLILIDRMTKIIKVDIGNPVDFYNAINKYYKKINFNKKNTSLTQKAIDDTIEVFKKYDEFPNEHYSKRQYFDLVTDNALFKRIMGQMTPQLKEEMENTMHTKINYAQIGEDVYNLSELSNNWENTLEHLMQKNCINEDQYKIYIRQINYLTDYYWSIKVKYQDDFDKEIITRVRAL